MALMVVLNNAHYAEHFAILILNDEHGAIIREAKPPKQ